MGVVSSLEKEITVFISNVGQSNEDVVDAAMRFIDGHLGTTCRDDECDQVRPADRAALEALYRRHWIGRRHSCGTPAGYRFCYDDEHVDSTMLAADLNAQGWAIEPDELRRLWDVAEAHEHIGRAS
jgi:hypothetical protein